MSGLGNKKIMANNIQYYMDKENKSRRDVCDALNVKYTTLTDWVKGNTYPRIDKIELMANYFGIEITDLIEERTEKPKKELTALSENEKALVMLFRKTGDIPEEEAEALRKQFESTIDFYLKAKGIESNGNDE